MTTKKFYVVLTIAVSLMLLLTGTALAAHGEEAGSCPPKWELHHFMDHEDHEHEHVGVARDLNGDGYICVKHTTSGKHVHKDNTLP